MLSVRFTIEIIQGLAFVLYSPRESANYSLIARYNGPDAGVAEIVKQDLFMLADTLDSTKELRVVAVVRNSDKLGDNAAGAIVLTRDRSNSVSEIVHAVLDSLQDHYASSVAMATISGADDFVSPENIL